MNFNWWIHRIEAWEKELKEMKKALKTYERKNRFIRNSRKAKVLGTVKTGENRKEILEQRLIQMDELNIDNPLGRKQIAEEIEELTRGKE